MQKVSDGRPVDLTPVAPGVSVPSKWLTLIAASLGLAMLSIDLFVVNVAFPMIDRDLGADLDAAEWIVSGYVLALAVLPIVMGRLGDILGRRAVYLAGLGTFVVASAACGASGTIVELAAFRVVQGVGAATMMAGTLAIVTRAFPIQERGLAVGIWGGVSGLGLIAGPVIGGLLVQGDNWRWVFLVNLPLGVIALLAALRFVPESRDDSVPRSIDWAGLILLSAGLTLIMLALTQVNRSGWTSPSSLAGFFGGLAVLGLFARTEARVPYPLIELSLFAEAPLVLACLSGFLFSAAVFGSQPFQSLFFQNYWGFTPLQGGLAFVPATGLVAAVTPLGGALGQRFGAGLRLVVVAGIIAVGISFLALVRLDSSSTYLGALLVPLMIRGIGIGLAIPAISLAVVNAVPTSKTGLASGMVAMSRNLGTAIGVAIFGSVFTQSVSRGLTAPLTLLGPVQSAAIRLAADNFEPTGDAVLKVVVGHVILAGFINLAVAGFILCALAALAAYFIRPPIRDPDRLPSDIDGAAL